MDSVLLPESILSAPTPSAKDGVSAAVERAHRSWGCLLACEAGVLLQLPQVVQATAQNLLQRFYWRKSLKDPRFDAFTVAMTCVFLATKIEETPRKLRTCCTPSRALPPAEVRSRSRSSNSAAVAAAAAAAAAAAGAEEE